MLIKPPQIDPRRYSEMLQQIRSLIPFYTPEWNASDDNEFGHALLHIFSHLTEDVISHLNRVPNKNFIAFLSMLGIELLPARPARVPVRFIPAPGTESGFRIPENTRLAAGATEQRPEELPFETEENLFAIRSALLNVVAVDPQNDAIFLPPLGFSELQLPAVPLPTYSFVSFAGAGSNTFQLDRVEGLEENDLLRIPPSNSSSEPDQNSSEALPPSSAEHLVVSATSGNIVTTIDKISRDYPANTKVEKVTRFHLFDSKDWQEHVLYLGHPDLFSIKNEAQFTVNVVHLAGTSAGIEPLNLAWEYWGEREGREEKDWWEFDIEGDGSAGFSRDGYIVLTKGKGEIKETELNGVSSRWIRCRLKDKIPSTEPIKLPNLDHIKFLIESTGDPVPADQGFYNDTPLDVNLPFFPFGTEPRTLDRFQFASEEIFSKKGAEITVDIGLDSGGILASTAAVVFEDLDSYPISVFARGTGGRLLEVRIDSASGAAEDWIDHEFPNDTAIAFPDTAQGLEARPAVVGYAAGGKRFAWVFLTADDGGLIELFCKGENCVWINHGRPKAGIKIKGDPSAVRSQVNQITVFVTGEDGILYRLNRDLSASKGDWNDKADKPTGKSLYSSPEAAVSDDGIFKIIVFVKGKDGNLYEWDQQNDRWAGASYKISGAKVDSRPLAEIYVNYVYLITIIGGKGAGQVRGIIDYDGNSQEATVESTWDRDKVPDNSSDYEIITAFDGFAQGGGSSSIILAAKASDNAQAYKGFQIAIIDSAGGIQLREIIDYVGSERKATVNPAWYKTPNKSFTYRILTPLDNAQTGTAQIIQLSDNASKDDDAYKDFWIVIREGAGAGQIRRIVDYHGNNQEATVDSEWDTNPDNSSVYELITAFDGVAQEGDQSSIILEKRASTYDKAYNGFHIAIIDETGAGQVHRVVDYEGRDRKATVDSPWDTVPDNNYKYRILTLQGEARGGSAKGIKLSAKSSKVSDTYSDFLLAKVFVKDDKGNIQKFDTRFQLPPENLGRPSTGVKVSSSACGFLINPAAENSDDEKKHIYVRGTDNHLWEKTDGGWEEHPPPSGSELRGTPYAVALNEDAIRIYSASAQNSIVEKQIVLELRGTAAIGSSRSVTIDDSASANDNEYKGMYIEILNGDGYVVDKKKITDYIGSLRLVRVSSNWKETLSADFRYRIVDNVFEGRAVSTTVQSVELDDIAFDGDNSFNGFKIEIGGQSHTIVSYTKAATSIAIIQSFWDSIPGEPFAYKIYHDPEDGTARGGTKNIILLDSSASDVDGTYVGVEIKMTGGDLSDQTRRIKSYKGSEKEAKLESNWDDDQEPAAGDTYEFLPLMGTAKNIIPSTIKLAGDSSATDGAYTGHSIEITAGIGSGLIRTITTYDGGNQTATVAGLDPTLSFPESGSDYLISKIVKKGSLRVGTDLSITLDSNASAQDDAYVGRRLSIAGEAPKVITDYLGIDRVARIDATWLTNPDSNSQYLIAGFDLWNEFEDPSEIALAPELSWEYWNDLGWVAFREQEHKFKDETRNLMISGKVEFILPEDIEKVEVSGQESYWIRARIASGDYGKETITLVEKEVTEDGVPKKIIELISSKSAIRPPLIISLKITYKLLEAQFPQSCLTYNNRNYIDQTDACQTASKWFSPFVKLEDIVKTIYLGFEDSVEGSPIKLLFAAKELKYTEEQKPKLTWSFRTNNKWEQVSSEDATDGLIRQEILQLQIPRGFDKFSIFGQSRFWIKGSLSKGRYDELPVLSGVFPNTTWTMQAETIQNEILGSSNGEEKQDFQFNKVSVLGGEKVRVLEVLSQEETDQLEQDIGPDAIFEEKDELDRVVGTWVLWKKVPYFFDSKPEDRHYKLDRALGRLEFGDGVHGQIPPAGQDNIRAFSYQAGGGAAGNILAGEIQTLSTAIAGVESVINPVAADGGADKATIEEMLDIGPGMISHRHRAVTIEDFELLAVEASRKIKKVRCLPNINNNRQPETGWVTVIIVPESKDDQPQPSLVLRREVQRFLAERCDGLIADRGRINVIGPVYKPINVEVDIYAESIDVASEAESQARDTLKKFFHPLTGGPEGNGWDFGRGLAASDIYVLLERIPGVDHIENLKFIHDSQKSEDIVQIAPHSLLSSGNLEINMRTAENV